ncbi:ARID/BRIGHT DNA binding domain-containing protein [Trichoderma breve]|uniref:ARID/BRIGHT DNA binding domain-containing protein n=1 Tax=Trichoderma breve TaxID=2034170 RepID=A0A9W9E3T6_9HYPO|nr:ARID/BRIGHT DNA binding domain-containing protein [Trichoderma breve]KAJ4857089.1 ARID/BRIGHT DNA binding domain-containing protein [Trichoderma breve]
MAELLRYTQEWHQQQQDIHPSDYIEETAEHNEIAELSSSLLALFKEIVLALSNHARIPGDARINIERSCSALILWSDGFGITQGRLNETFNKSRKLRYTTLKNLLHIGRVLTERLVPAVNISSEKIKVLCSNVELNIEAAAGLIAEESCRQSDDSSSDAASNFSDDDIYEIAEDLKTDTLVLSGLDPLLKHPIFDAQHEHIIESHALSTWGPEKSYSDKIGNRFPRADVSLTLYLGRANYERFLRCQEAREYQEEEEPLPIVNQEAGTHAGTIITNTKFHDSGVGTSIALTMSYAETTMSYNHDGQSVRIPPLPKEAKAGSPFICIACGRTVIITNNSAWKQHIYLDLQPYMCLDLSCPYSSSTFESRDKWIAHLALDHEMEPKWASAECPLCREETGNGKIAITKHHSKHLEEVSLSALPVEVDSDAESENSPESSDANYSLDEGAYVDKLKTGRNQTAQSEAKGGALQKASKILTASEAENVAAQLKKTQQNIEEMVRKKEGTSKMAKLLSPIKFTDAVGRRFNFPVHLCYTWQEMDHLIKQAFSQVDILGPRVQAGHYDLTGPDGNIILPSVWEETVEPGLHITMTMWLVDKGLLASIGLKESEQSPDEGNSEKDNSFQNNTPSKRQQGVQHSEDVQAARIIRMSGQNFFNTVKTYFKDQPDKFTRFRVILADITTTEWVPEAWQRSCFECRVAEAECDAKSPDPCTRCRLKKLSCAVQFATVSRQHTFVNGDQIRQGITNIGRLCDGYPSFMHELNSVMPTGYQVEVLDALTVRLFEPHNKQSTIQIGISEPAIMGLNTQDGLDTEPNQQGKSMSEALSRPTLADRNSSEDAMMEQEESCSQQSFQQHRENMMSADLTSISAHYFNEPQAQMGAPPSQTSGIPQAQLQALQAMQASSPAMRNGVPSTIGVQISSLEEQFRSKDSNLSPEQLRRLAIEHLTRAMMAKQQSAMNAAAGGQIGLDKNNTPKLAYAELNKTVESYVDKVEQRFIGSPRISGQLLEVLLDAQNGTRSTENAYMVAKELFGMNSDLLDEFQKELTKLNVDLLQRRQSELNDISEAPDEASITVIDDSNQDGEVRVVVGNKGDSNNPDEPQSCLCNRGSVGIMIRCDNVDGCKYKWFHLECVGLTVAPSSKEKWYCPDCRGHVNIEEKTDIDLQVLPPDPTNPKVAMDTEPSTGEGSTDILFGTQANLDYLEGLAKFHKQQGNNLNRLPYVDKKPVDVYRLKNLVESRGGFDKVCKSKEWAEIAKDLGYSGRIMSSLSTSLKNSFLQWLSPYEEYLRAAKPGDDHQLEEERVNPRNKGKEIPSIGWINYDSPNPDIYIWPPEPDVSGEDESELAGSSSAPPPLPPPVMEATNPFTDRVKSSNDPELSSPSSDRRGLFDGEYTGHEPFLARPRPDTYTKQLPPISGVSEASNSAEGDSSEKFVLSPNPFLSSFGSGDATLPCEAEPQEQQICLQRFKSNKQRNRHYWAFHNDYAKQRGIQDPIECTICGSIFIRREYLKRHIKDRHFIHEEHGTVGQDAVRASSEELTDLDDKDFTDLGPDAVNAVAAEARGLPDERDREFFHAKVGAQVAQESAMQDKNVSPNDEYMQAQAQAQALYHGQPSAAHNDDFIIKAPSVSSQIAFLENGLSPKIWTGTHFLPRFIRAAEVPGEGMCYFYDDGSHCKTVIDGEVVNAHWGVTKEGKPRKRLAIACITCREKKTKCDPDYPRCVQCEKYGRVCKFKNAPKGGNIPLPSTSSIELDDGGDLRRSISDVRSPGSPSSRAGMQPVIKIPGTLIEYDGSDFHVTVSTNSAVGAGPGSGMPGGDKESTVYQAQAQAQDQARGPQQADDDSTLQGEIQARGRRIIWDRLMEVAAEQFSDPENVP